jgi:hypothetical protein
VSAASWAWAKRTFDQLTFATDNDGDLTVTTNATKESLQAAPEYQNPLSACKSPNFRPVATVGRGAEPLRGRCVANAGVKLTEV